MSFANFAEEAISLLGSVSQKSGVDYQEAMDAELEARRKQAALNAAWQHQQDQERMLARPASSAPAKPVSLGAGVNAPMGVATRKAGQGEQTPHKPTSSAWRSIHNEVSHNPKILFADGLVPVTTALSGAPMRPAASIDDELRRSGGGGGSTISVTPAHSAAAISRAQLASGAQPAVFKVISSGSSAIRGGALMEYLGTRQVKKGEKIDIEMRDEAGNPIVGHAARKALMDDWRENFAEDFQTTNFVEFSFTRHEGISDEALNEALNDMAGSKPFVYAVAGNKVSVFAYRDQSSLNLAKGLSANKKGEDAPSVAVSRYETKLDDFLREHEIGEGATLSGAVTRGDKAQYFLQKFLRTNDDWRTHSGDDLQKGKPHEDAGKLYADWQAQFKTIERRNFYHVIFSARAGADPAIVLEAARATLDQELPGHRYVLSHHADTGHVHVHAAIKAIPEHESASTLRFLKADLYRVREVFAEKATELGLPMTFNRRMDLAASRPYTMNQAGAARRARHDARYQADPRTIRRVEMKKQAAMDRATLAVNGQIIADNWMETSTQLKDGEHLMSATTASTMADNVIEASKRFANFDKSTTRQSADKPVFSPAKSDYNQSQNTDGKHIKPVTSPSTDALKEIESRIKEVLKMPMTSESLQNNTRNMLRAIDKIALHYPEHSTKHDRLIHFRNNFAARMEDRIEMLKEREASNSGSNSSRERERIRQRDPEKTRETEKQKLAAAKAKIIKEVQQKVEQHKAREQARKTERERNNDLDR